MNGSAKSFQDVIAKLHKAIADYHEGLVRIDREFNAPKKGLNEDQERNREIRKSNWQSGFAAYSDEICHRFQSNVGHFLQRKRCHSVHSKPSQSFRSMVGH